MDEISVPLAVEVDPSHNLNHLLAERVATKGDQPLMEHKPDPDGPWVPVTAREFDALVVAVAKGLVAKGVEPGQSVGIMSRTRFEWSLLDWATWAAGAVPVPLYETSSAEQVEWICSDSAVGLVVTETAELASLVESVRGSLPGLGEVFVIDDGGIDALVAAGEAVPDEELARRRSLADLDSLATIIYTSGTTGRPKGAELTHGNFVELSLNALAELGDEVCPPGSRTLLFMPLAHVFARSIGVLVFPAGAVPGHTPDTKDLIEDMGTFKPTFILSVPRVFEKVYNSAEQKAAADGKLKVFRMAAATAEDYSRALDSGKPGLGLRLRHAVFDKLVYSKPRKVLGG